MCLIGSRRVRCRHIHLIAIGWKSCCILSFYCLQSPSKTEQSNHHRDHKSRWKLFNFRSAGRKPHNPEHCVRARPVKVRLVAKSRRCRFRFLSFNRHPRKSILLSLLLLILLSLSPLILLLLLYFYHSYKPTRTACIRTTTCCLVWRRSWSRWETLAGNDNWQLTKLETFDTIDNWHWLGIGNLWQSLLNQCLHSKNYRGWCAQWNRETCVVRSW